MEDQNKEQQQISEKIKNLVNYKIELPQYKDVELTQDEVNEGLRLLRKEKHRQITNTAYWEKINNPPPPPEYTPDELGLVIINKFEDKYKTKFEMTSPKVINSLLSYFCNQEGICNLDKGIMLAGGVGVGKTVLMSLLAQNQKDSFIVVPCRKVAQDYVNGGPDGKGGIKAIEKYFKPMYVTKNIFGHGELGICFDDLGTEGDKKNFGNELNVMAEIILDRYDNPNLKGKTHFTTNLSAEEINEIYGPRVSSRLREMVNICAYEGGKDLRT